jgi:CheY-like chemotaxis protein
MAETAGSRSEARPVVLVVEDEPTIRTVIARVLELDGYRVLVAENGHSALALIATLGRPIDLIVTDITMPELDGEALVAEVARHQRPPPILVISGAGQADLQQLSHPFLCKPFTPDDLRAQVRQLVGRASLSERDPKRSA